MIFILLQSFFAKMITCCEIVGTPFVTFYSVLSISLYRIYLGTLTWQANYWNAHPLKETCDSLTLHATSSWWIDLYSSNRWQIITCRSNTYSNFIWNVQVAMKVLSRKLPQTRGNLGNFMSTRSNYIVSPHLLPGRIKIGGNNYHGMLITHQGKLKEKSANVVLLKEW